ncbi:MAG: PQQ-binding-like beta-propeller repeat protein [Planctomycetaceae bacterium]
MVLASLLSVQSSFADWRQFRGSDSSAVALDSKLPTEWVDGDKPQNIGWKVTLPGRGLGSPIVVNGRVFVTCSSGFAQDRLHVLCFDAAKGTKLWERQFWATGRTMTHPKTCTAGSSPCSDGQRIFALFSSNDIACLDLDGNLQWFRGITHDFPNCSNSLGMASSPIVIGDTLIAQTENDADSFANGLDVYTGESRWKRSRPKRASWTSPSPLKDMATGEMLALLQSSAGVDAVKPQTGEVVWNYKNGAGTIPSLTVSEGVAYVPSNGLTAIQSEVGKSEPKQLWNVGKLGPGTPSPLVHNKRVYVMDKAGVLTCASLEMGQTEWQLRLEGPITSSPVAAGDRLYFVNEVGVCQVVQLGAEKGEVVGKSELTLGKKEPADIIQSTPAIDDNALFIRSDAFLWKIADSNGI